MSGGVVNYPSHVFTVQRKGDLCTTAVRIRSMREEEALDLSNVPSSIRNLRFMRNLVDGDKKAPSTRVQTTASSKTTNEHEAACQWSFGDPSLADEAKATAALRDFNGWSKIDYKLATGGTPCLPGQEQPTLSLSWVCRYGVGSKRAEERYSDINEKVIKYHEKVLHRRNGSR